MDDTKLIIKAATFAADKHRNQRRKGAGNMPYINHPLGVANYITSLGGVTDANIICAALLHDTVEDTDTTYDELVHEFGPKIASIVAEVTDDKSLPKVERKKLQVMNAPHKSYEAKVIKLADKLHNLTDLLTNPVWGPEITRGYFIWSFKVVEGLRGTNTPLESKLDEVFADFITPGLNLDAELTSYYDIIL